MLKSFLVLSLATLLSGVSYARTYSYGFVSDAGMALEGATVVRKALERERIKKLVLAGDQLYNPNDTYDTVWGMWSGFQWFAVAHGNHSLTYEAEQEYFGMSKEYYTKKVGDNILFVVLNSDNTHNADEQAVWLDDVLKNATQKFVFVVQHHPPYTISRYHVWEERKDFHLLIRPILQKYSNKIDAFFTGHDHFSSLYKINELVWVHSGSVLQHKRIQPTNGEVEPGVRLKTLWVYDEQYYFLRLDIDEDAGTAKVAYVRARDRHRSCVVSLEPEFALSDGCRN